MTFQSLLVPLDGSQFGEHALPHALSLARRSGARLTLLHVRAPLVHFSSADIYLPITPEEEAEATRQAQAYLEDVAGRIRSASTVPVEPVLLHGQVVDSICEYVEQSRPDLIVCTTHGRGPLSRLWLGSVATDLSHRSPAPLLLVRPADGPPDLTADVTYKKLLIPLDGSPFAEQILPLAVAVGTLNGSAYRLLRVVPPVLIGGWTGWGSPPVGVRSVAEQLQAEAADYLTRIASQHAELAGAETQVVADWPPATAILADVEAHGIDLIAMETRGRSGILRLFLGSVADKVVRGASVPVLLRRPESA